MFLTFIQQHGHISNAPQLLLGTMATTASTTSPGLGTTSGTGLGAPAGGAGTYGRVIVTLKSGEGAAREGRVRRQRCPLWPAANFLHAYSYCLSPPAPAAHDLRDKTW